MRTGPVILFCVCTLVGLGSAAAQAATVAGTVRDQTGGALPGVTVELTMPRAAPLAASTDPAGRYRFEGVAPGTYTLSFRLLNFGDQYRRDLQVSGAQTVTVDAVLSLALSADVVVVAKRTFANLADIDNPAENLVGIAQSASQGAITARQLDVRPIMRPGEVLETVPGVIITQHSGEGKANQYFLRGFNLDHGSDFAMTVAGTPVNMPSHAHSQGYSDINFMIPEIVAGVQFSKGPYFAEQGDFATAGSSNITYATELDRPIVHAEVGAYGFRRALFAASPKVGNGHLLAALETSTNDGPWTVPDSYRKFNGVLRYSQGDQVNGFSLTAMGYHGTWRATEASPTRAVDAGLIDRFGSIDASDGGHTYRYAAAADWQHGTNATLTKVTAYGIAYDLDLISNFTFFLNDPVHGDQIEQVDHRFVSGAKVSHRRLTRWGGRGVQNTFGVQLRNDVIPEVALFHTEKRVRLDTRADDAVLVTSAGVYAQNEIEWTRWFRTSAGVRLDGTRYRIDALDTANSGVTTAAIVSPKGGAIFGPWKGTEFYLNAGTGFHSNSAQGTTITRDADGLPVDRVTPLVRAKGGEVGVRTVAIPHVQTTVSLWTLRLGSELVYNGDAGATEPGPASERHGVELANYYSPYKWLTFDGDLSLSRARFSDVQPAGQFVPEAVGTVVSAGASVDGFHRAFGSLRWRYFGPRALVQDDSVRSKATSLVNMQGGYQLLKNLRATVDIFNLLNEQVSDIDYYFASRLPGEPLGGVEDIHFHPAAPRTIRISAVIGF
ncbi:MAG: tonB-dependent Receptor Plug domain protein [Acidobacteria bacterium]|nr:tonB-dependent Receptor Plug domain protein [Acidobacteriota bacterium]